MPGSRSPFPGATWGGGQWASRVGPQGALPCGGVSDVSLSVVGSRHCREAVRCVPLCPGFQALSRGWRPADGCCGLSPCPVPPPCGWSLCPLGVAGVSQRGHLVHPSGRPSPAIPGSLVHWSSFHCVIPLM